MTRVLVAINKTRREHLQELLARLQLRQFDGVEYRAMAECLLPVAMQTTQGMVLARALVEQSWLRFFRHGCKWISAGAI